MTLSDPSLLTTWLFWLAFTIAMAVAQAVVNELLAPALREWRERRAAAAKVPGKRREPRDWLAYAMAGMVLVTFILAAVL
jgi:Lon protease-like protein